MSTETTTTEKPNVIVRLTSRNYKCLKAIEIVPNGAAVVINGKNDNGKSAVLEAIHATIRGDKIPLKPIRTGAAKSDTICEFGDFIAKLSITEKSGASIRVESKTGVNITGPRTFLKDHSNEILLDPVGFMRLGDTIEGRRKQAEVLRRLVNLDFTALESEKATKYQERTLINREVATLQGKLAGFPEATDAPEKEVSVEELVKQLQAVDEKGNTELDAAKERNRKNAQVKMAWEEASKALSEHMEEVHHIELEIQATEQLLKELKASFARYKENQKNLEILRNEGGKKVAELVYVDEDAVRAATTEARKPIQEQIFNAQTINRNVQQNARRKEVQTELADKQIASQALSNRLEEIEQAKKDQLAAAKFPLEGLSFDESGILFNGLPLSQGSQAQQIKAVLAIGFAFKPKIRVTLIKDASILDSESMAEVEKMTAAEGGQAWLETVESDDPAAITIVEGEVAA